MHTNCVGVFCEIDSMTHKKGASRPMQLSHKTTEALIDSRVRPKHFMNN
jgi:hypothetical protein